MAAFWIGMLVPVLVSVVSMMVSFDLGMKLATILAPPTLLADRWPDVAIPLANGLLYGFLALALTSLMSKPE